MDEALTLGDYLPLSFKSASEQAYVAFLWDAFQSNYENGKYQFAFLAFHMLTMSFVYCNVWQIKNVLADDYGKAMVGFSKDVEKELMEATTPFTFSRVNESNIFRFLKLIGCDNGRIGQYTRLVKDRNEIAHPNGNIFYEASETLDRKISETLRLVEEIERQSAPLIIRCYESFLLESHDPETRPYIDDEDQIREALIHQNYLSQKDIEICKGFDIDCLNSDPHFETMHSLHELLVKSYQVEE